MFVTVDADGNNVEGETTYKAFADCFYEWKSEWNGEAGVVPTDWNADAQTDFEAIASKFISIDMMEFLWLSEACNGICKSGLFGFASILEDKQPVI